MAKFTLRLPDDLQEIIQTRADHEERSLHAQIIYTLREAVQRTGAPARSTHAGHKGAEPDEAVELMQAEGQRKRIGTEIKLMQRNPDGTISPYEGGTLR